jgi:molybdate transport system substrate-binding protein
MGGARMRVWLCVALVAAAAWVRVDRGEAAEIKVLSAGAVRSVVSGLAEAFGRETGHTVMLTFGTVGALRQKLAAGEPADVLILTDVAIDDLARQGAVAIGTRTDIGRTAMGVAVREGAPLPDISTADAFKQTLLSAKSLTYVDPAQGATSGVHFAGVLKRLGIAEAMKGKTRLVAGGYPAELVAKGEAELVAHQISEIIPVKGVTLVGPLPKDLQKITTYSAGLAARSAVADAARGFVAFVSRPSFKARFAEAGLDYRE